MPAAAAVDLNLDVSDTSVLGFAVSSFELAEGARFFASNSESVD
jgi:hypothetical protein